MRPVPSTIIPDTEVIMEVIPATITATILIRTEILMMGLDRVEGPGEQASTITKAQVTI